MITVFLRFDDYSETSSEAVEQGLVHALRVTRTSATFGVIPAVTEGSYHVPGDRPEQRLSQDKIRFLQQAVADGVVEVALHGWNHRSQSSSPPHGEFIRVDAKAQLDRLVAGLRSFESAGINATVFVPPWNAYNSETLAALKQTRLRCLSANRYGPAIGPLNYLPITASFDQLRAALEGARTSGDPDPIVGVLLHPYDFEESGDARAITNCQSFEQELRWLAKQPDVRVRTIGQVTHENPDLDVSRYEANSPLFFESIFPPFLRTTSQTSFFRSAPMARRIKLLRTIATILTYGLAALTSGLIGSLAWNRFELKGQAFADVLRIALALLVLALAVRIVASRMVYFRGMLALSVLGGLLIAVWA